MSKANFSYESGVSFHNSLFFGQVATNFSHVFINLYFTNQVEKLIFYFHDKSKYCDILYFVIYSNNSEIIHETLIILCLN